jgi:hypothetical protein
MNKGGSCTAARKESDKLPDRAAVLAEKRKTTGRALPVVSEV